MLAETLLKTITRTITHVSLIATEGAGAALLPVVLVVVGDEVVNSNELIFEVPMKGRASGLRFFNSRGEQEHAVSEPEQRFQRKGHMIYAPGAIRIRIEQGAA